MHFFLEGMVLTKLFKNKKYHLVRIYRYGANVVISSLIYHL